MRWLVLMTLGACGFTGQGVPDGATGAPSDALSDAPDATDAPPDAPIDAPLDAPPDVAPLCNVGLTTAPGTDRGRVGGNNGGSNFGPLICDAAPGDQIIGLAARLSDGNTVFGAPSILGLVIACAPVRIDATGAGTVGAEYTKEVMGQGTSNWLPATLSAVTRCPPGWVVSGLQAYQGAGANRFIDVSMRCSQIGYTGQPGAFQILAVMGSGSETTGIDTVNCNSNEVIGQMPNRTGAGFDSVNLFCSPIACQ